MGRRSRSGVSLVEVLSATALLALLVIPLLEVIAYGQGRTVFAEDWAVGGELLTGVVETLHSSHVASSVTSSSQDVVVNGRTYHITVSATPLDASSSTYKDVTVIVSWSMPWAHSDSTVGEISQSRSFRLMDPRG